MHQTIMLALSVIGDLFVDILWFIAKFFGIEKPENKND